MKLYRIQLPIIISILSQIPPTLVKQETISPNFDFVKSVYSPIIKILDCLFTFHDKSTGNVHRKFVRIINL